FPSTALADQSLQSPMLLTVPSLLFLQNENRVENKLESVYSANGGSSFEHSFPPRIAAHGRDHSELRRQQKIAPCPIMFLPKGCAEIKGKPPGPEKQPGR